MEITLYFASGLAVGILFGAVVSGILVALMHGFFPYEKRSDGEALALALLFAACAASAAIWPDLIGFDSFMRSQFGALWRPALVGTMMGGGATGALIIYRKLNVWD